MFLKLSIFLVVFIDSLSLLGIFFPAGIKHLLIIVLFSINVLVAKKLIINRRVFLLSLLLIFYIVINTIFNDINLISFSVSFVYFILFVVCFHFGYIQTFNKHKLNNILLYVLKISFIPILFSFISIILSSDVRNAAVSFREINVFASFILLSIIFCFHLFNETNRNIFLKYALLLSILIFISSIKKSIVILFILWFLFLNFRNLKYKYIYNFLVIPSLFMLSILIYSDQWIRQFTYFDAVGAENHVRLGMFVTSFYIFNDFFPIGSGVGSFGSIGSLISDINNSLKINWQIGPLYYEYNIANIADNSNEKLNNGNSTFLDTFWPHIIAELGFIGSLIYFTIIYKIYRTVSSININLSLFTVMLFLFLFIDGLALYTPEMPIFVLIIFSLFGYLYSYQVKYFKSRKNE